jgi:hypothetical protein
MPQQSPLTGNWGSGEQGVQAVLSVIEARLQALEQAIFGGNYQAQQVNLGSIGAITSNPTGNAVGMGQSAAGSR